MKDLQSRIKAVEAELADIKKELKPDTRTITERVTSYETACLEIGTPQIGETLYPKDVAAYMKLRIIAEALNEGHKFTYTPDEYRYYPWFEINPAGFVRVLSTNAASNTSASIGARLCFKTRTLAEYAGRTFLDIYQDFLIDKT